MINNFIIKSKVWLYAGPPAGGGRWHFLTVPKSPFGNSPTMSLFFEFQDLRTAAFRTGGAGSLKSGFGQFLCYFPAVFVVVPGVRLQKSSENASNLAQCVSPV